jgi:preprotein translocase subunit SecE
MAGHRTAAEDKNAGTVKFFRETKIEMKKVIWPTRQQMLRYSVAVVISVILVSLLIMAVDFVFMGFSKLLINVVG